MGHRFITSSIRSIPWCLWKSKAKKFTAMAVGNWFQVHALLVHPAIITFITNVQKHPLKLPTTLSIPTTQVFFFDKDLNLILNMYMVVHYARKNVTCSFMNVFNVGFPLTSNVLTYLLHIAR
ncbi:hypothetical protein V6N13_062673 [Hibiscus sabdariffa]